MIVGRIRLQILQLYENKYTSKENKEVVVYNAIIFDPDAFTKHSEVSIDSALIASLPGGLSDLQKKIQPNTIYDCPFRLAFFGGSPRPIPSITLMGIEASKVQAENESKK